MCLFGGSGKISDRDVYAWDARDGHETARRSEVDPVQVRSDGIRYRTTFECEVKPVTARTIQVVLGLIPVVAGLLTFLGYGGYLAIEVGAIGNAVLLTGIVVFVIYTGDLEKFDKFVPDRDSISQV